MFKRTLLTVATLSLFPLDSMAALPCAPGLKNVTVNGSVTTLNVSETKQVGQICLTLIRTENGRQVFNDCGALIGKVVATEPATGTSTLTHTAVFDLRNIFVTQNDVAQIYYPTAYDETGNACAFHVEETMTEIANSTGIFRDGQINVKAEGTISFCPGKNLNTFTLAGEACVR